jgi:fucose 4-O-acetylase-like acetyltransferase
MNSKTSKVIYWTGAILTSLWFGASGFYEFSDNQMVWNLTVKLGYPRHFIYALGVAKILGVIVLLIPNRFLRLKEWVFAGIFFVIIFAIFSKMVVLGFPDTIDAIVAFVLVGVTYVMFRRLYVGRYERAWA